MNMADEKKYIATVRKLTPRPRSSRLREQGIGSAAGTTIVLGQAQAASGNAPGTGAGGSGHEHANKADLDRLSINDGYVVVDNDAETTDPQTGESVVEKVSKKAKAGHADEAGHADSAGIADEARGLTADSPTREDFLSSNEDDEAEGLITFSKGWRTKGHVPGIAGTGARVGADGAAEMESLTLRKWLEVPELRYNRVDVSVGNRWRCPGAGIIERVTAAADGTGTAVLHLEKGEIGSIAVGDLCMGIFHDNSSGAANEAETHDDGVGGFKFAGFTTVYFKVTEITEAAMNSAFKYSVRPSSAYWASQAHPFAGMHFCAFGNDRDATRRSSRYSTLKYERYLRNVSDWVIDKDNVAAQFGDLSNLSVFGLSMTGYSAYLDSIYLTGVIQSLNGRSRIDFISDALNLGDQLVWKDGTLKIKGSVIVDGSGQQVTLPNYKGLWEATTSYSKGDTVTYQGTTYIYVYALPTSGHSVTETVYWSVYAKAGDTGKDGESFYHIEVTADGSTSLRSANDTLTLAARIFYGSTDVTDKFADAEVFWTRKSEAGESASWDGRTHTGKTLTIGYSDIVGADFFYANVGVETTGDALMSLGSVLIKIGNELIKV